MDSSSDDELPLINRKIALSVQKEKRAALRIDSSDSSLPSWIQNTKSEKDVESKRQVDAMLTDSDSDQVETSQRLVKIGKEDEGNPKDEEVKREENSYEVRRMNQSQPQGSQPETPSAQPEAQQTKLAQPQIKVADVSSVPLMLPEKMPKTRLLMELESRDALLGATELSGDSGAIGRILVQSSGKDGAETAELDLKGSLYTMTCVECPGTLMVINLGVTEAKVESIYDSFIQLREDKRFTDEEGAAKLKQWLEDDDDDDDGVDTGPSTQEAMTNDESNKAGRKKKTVGAKKAVADARKAIAKPARQKKTTKKPNFGRKKKK